jgi:hypothetical protein
MARTFPAALTIALLLAVPGQSHAADPEPQTGSCCIIRFSLQAMDRLRRKPAVAVAPSKLSAATMVVITRLYWILRAGRCVIERRCGISRAA